LVSRDEFVSMHRTSSERQLEMSPFAFSDRARAEELHNLDLVTDALYRRRGAVISLGVLNFVLSFLLFNGCARALRGLQSGVPLWKLAATLSVPYTLLAFVLTVLVERDQALILAQATSGTVLLNLQVTGAQWVRAGAALVSAVEIGYYVLSVIYLR